MARGVMTFQPVRSISTAGRATGNLGRKFQVSGSRIESGGISIPNPTFSSRKLAEFRHRTSNDNKAPNVTKLRSGELMRRKVQFSGVNSGQYTNTYGSTDFIYRKPANSNENFITHRNRANRIPNNIANDNNRSIKSVNEFFTNYPNIPVAVNDNTRPDKALIPQSKKYDSGNVVQLSDFRTREISEEKLFHAIYGNNAPLLINAEKPDQSSESQQHKQERLKGLKTLENIDIPHQSSNPEENNVKSEKPPMDSKETAGVQLTAESVLKQYSNITKTQNTKQNRSGHVRPQTETQTPGISILTSDSQSKPEAVKLGPPSIMKQESNIRIKPGTLTASNRMPEKKVIVIRRVRYPDIDKETAESGPDLSDKDKLELLKRNMKLKIKTVYIAVEKYIEDTIEPAQKAAEQSRIEQLQKELRALIGPSPEQIEASRTKLTLPDAREDHSAGLLASNLQADMQDEAVHIRPEASLSTANINQIKKAELNSTAKKDEDRKMDKPAEIIVVFDSAKSVRSNLINQQIDRIFDQNKKTDVKQKTLSGKDLKMPSAAPQSAMSTISTHDGSYPELAAELSKAGILHSPVHARALAEAANDNNNPVTKVKSGGKKATKFEIEKVIGGTATSMNISFDKLAA